MGQVKSIIQDKKECYFCKTTLNLHLHHCLFGTYKRKKADENGIYVYLCMIHHEQLHKNRAMQEYLIKLGQTKFEELYGHDKFMEVFKKNYL